MDVWMYTYMHVLHACMYMHVHVRVRVHMPVHVRVHVHGHVYVHVLGMLLYMYMYVHGYVCKASSIPILAQAVRLSRAAMAGNPYSYGRNGELIQSILCVLQHLETQGDRAALLHHLLVQESDQPQTPTRGPILYPSKEELLQSILLLHIASWIQTFNCKKLRRLPMFASKNITTEHRM